MIDKLSKAQWKLLEQLPKAFLSKGKTKTAESLVNKHLAIRNPVLGGIKGFWYDITEKGRWALHSRCPCYGEH